MGEMQEAAGRAGGAPHTPAQPSPTPVMLRMLSAMPVGVPVPAAVSACRMRIMPSSLCSVFFRQEPHTSSLLDTCREAGTVFCPAPAQLNRATPPLAAQPKLGSSMLAMLLGAHCGHGLSPSPSILQLEKPPKCGFHPHTSLLKTLP